MDKKRVTARELAERFGVSRQTICRDIDTLSTSGIPIYTERGKGGGISLLPDFVLNKSMLSEQEQQEILSALHGLSNIKTDETERTLQKLSTIFNKPTINWLEIDYSGWSHENDYFNDFKTAIFERRIVEFDYYNSYGEKTLRSVEPLQIWFKSKSWYLKGFCLAKQDIRLYKLSRIKNLLITNENFTERDSLDMTSSIVKDNFKGQQHEEIKLCIAPEMAHRVYDDFYESIVEKQPDGSFIVTVEWPQNNWLYGFILSFGRHIEVIAPKHLQEVIKKEAEKISEKYL